MALKVWSNERMTDYDINSNFKGSSVKQIYTGTALNINSTTTANVEMTAITAANLGSADYLRISATFTVSITTTDYSDGANAYLQLQTKETGGAYADSMAETVIDYFQYNNSQGSREPKAITTMATIVWYHTLTAGEKANGVQVKVIDRLALIDAGTASMTLKQCVIETVN